MESQDVLSLIAPCGMNCGICIAYMREKRKCPGCRGPDINKPVTRWECKIRNCTIFQKDKPSFCFECRDFPCDKLRRLDKRYRTKYNMSMIGNLENIRDHGLVQFSANEKTRWSCSKCGGTICVHKGHCYKCGEPICNRT